MRAASYQGNPTRFLAGQGPIRQGAARSERGRRRPRPRPRRRPPGSALPGPRWGGLSRAGNAACRPCIHLAGGRGMPLMIETDEKLNLVWWLMRIGLGVGLFLAGLDKFFDLLTTWSM